MEEDWSGLYFQTHLYLAHEIEEFNRFPDIMDAEFDYRCELVFFPTEAGILAMYFGNDKVRHILESTKIFEEILFTRIAQSAQRIFLRKNGIIDWKHGKKHLPRITFQ